MLKDKFWNITILYGLGEALTRAITFLLLAFHTNTELFNSVKEQEQLFVLYPFLAFMNALYAFGMHQSFFKYTNNVSCLTLDKSNLEHLDNIVTSIFFISVVQKTNFT